MKTFLPRFQHLHLPHHASATAPTVSLVPEGLTALTVARAELARGARGALEEGSRWSKPQAEGIRKCRAPESCLPTLPWGTRLSSFAQAGLYLIQGCPTPVNWQPPRWQQIKDSAHLTASSQFHKTRTKQTNKKSKDREGDQK